jgi:hypothetical protein
MAKKENSLAFFKKMHCLKRAVLQRGTKNCPGHWMWINSGSKSSGAVENIGSVPWRRGDWTVARNMQNCSVSQDLL